MTAVSTLTTPLAQAFHKLAKLDRPAIQTPADVSISATGGPLGAVVTGLDANRPLSSDLVLRLKQALDNHHILIFKQQQLNDDHFLAFSTYFGSVFRPPEDIPVLASGTGGTPPDVVPVSNQDGGYTGSGELTPHIDHQWTPLPSAGSLLYALEVPQSGGRTSWYNIARAYADLDEATRNEIDQLQLITYNPFTHPRDLPRRLYRTPDLTPTSHGFPHPLVRTHPSSGKKVLFLSTHTEVELPGIDPQHGQALIARLRQHLQNPKYRYEHDWEVGDIVYWDNQATLHSRTAFSPEERRVLKRVSLAGSRPF
ncbi:MULTISPECIES: TauD/TfdA dioxygenase family protein [Silvimonas]|uniref:TauD/TfdA dioxygenase family protein n=1 Tax=Silvimonas TaxID=300264 RepID=UPI0024B341A6|nr:MULTISPECIES: TauD/TfdA family dioxygenase [Silvimonas]MDR3427483.1 TauD/TfdA family dioxygenase [Silvimonas sp.]